MERTVTIFEKRAPDFPVPHVSHYSTGLSKREYFAAAVMQGHVASHSNEKLPTNEGESVEDAMARYWSGMVKHAYMVADLMLAEGSKTRE